MNLHGLRDYQQRQHDKALAAWGVLPWWDGESEVRKSIILRQPTAGGKTRTASVIIKTLVDMGHRCLFTADTTELCSQPLETLHRSVGIIAGLEKAQSKASLHSMAVVASAQSMVQSSHLERFPVDHFQFIFADEAHEGPGRMEKIRTRFPNAKVCGLTATPFRIGMADLSKWYSYIADELDLDELIDGGYIPPVEIITDPLPVDFSSLKMSVTKNGKDVNAEDSDRRIIPFFEAIVERLITRRPNAVALSFLGLRDTSRKFVEVCMGNGFPAKHVDGESDRQEIFEWYTQSTGGRLLSNAQLLKKGWDCDVVDTLIPLRLTNSVSEIRQQAGRALRPLRGILDGLNTPEERRAAIANSAKPRAVIFDFLGLCEEMGLSGPACILGDSPEECKEMAKIMKKRPEADLQEIRRKVREERERKLREKLEAAAREKEQREHKRATMMDARQMVLDLHERELADYVPVLAWERGKPHHFAKLALEKYGIDPEGVSAGLASKLIDSLNGRQRRGLAPVEAFAPLRAAGVAEPEKCTLNHCISVLRENFPMTFGRAHLGVPISQVPHSYWSWLMNDQEVAAVQSRARVEKDHPAIFRYVTKIIFPAQQPELV